MTAVTSLQYIHKKGRFGNSHKKDGKSLLQISEVKNLAIIQLVQYKKSKIELGTIKIGDLDLPLESPKEFYGMPRELGWLYPVKKILLVLLKISVMIKISLLQIFRTQEL
jgi:hypothetical protein